MPVRMIGRSCPLCGSLDKSHVFAPANFDLGRLDKFAFASRKIPEHMNFRLVICPDCDLLYADPILPPERISKAYEQAAFGSGEEALAASRTYGRLLDGLMPSLPGRQGALDIGTGDGAFLEELLKRGFKGVVGVEPSKAPIRSAKKPIRGLIRNQGFVPGAFPKDSFGLVSCFQTLEHLTDPLRVVLGSRRILRPGGLFLVVAHNRKALATRLLFRKSPIYDIEHLQLFSVKSARSLFKKAGFVRVRVFSLSNTYSIHYWVKLLPLPFSIKARVLGWLKDSAVGKWRITLRAGNMVVLGYKPGERTMARKVPAIPGKRVGRSKS